MRNPIFVFASMIVAFSSLTFGAVSNQLAFSDALQKIDLVSGLNSLAYNKELPPFESGWKGDKDWSRVKSIQDYLDRYPNDSQEPVLLTAMGIGLISPLDERILVNSVLIANEQDSLTLVQDDLNKTSSSQTARTVVAATGLLLGGGALYWDASTIGDTMPNAPTTEKKNIGFVGGVGIVGLVIGGIAGITALVVAADDEDEVAAQRHLDKIQQFTDQNEALIQLIQDIQRAYLDPYRNSSEVRSSKEIQDLAKYYAERLKEAKAGAREIISKNHNSTDEMIAHRRYEERGYDRSNPTPYSSENSILAITNGYGSGGSTSGSYTGPSSSFTPCGGDGCPKDNSGNTTSGKRKQGTLVLTPHYYSYVSGCKHDYTSLAERDACEARNRSIQPTPTPTPETKALTSEQYKKLVSEERERRCAGHWKSREEEIRDSKCQPGKVCSRVKPLDDPYSDCYK